MPLGLNETTGAIDCNADLVLDDADLRTGTDCFGYRDTDGDPFAGDFDRDGRVETEASGGSLNIDWDVGDVTITSITAYQKVERLQSEDTDAGPFPLIQPTFGAETKTFTQELRAAGGSDAFRWLVGAFSLQAVGILLGALPPRPDQPRIRVLRRRLRAEQRVAGRVRPGRV